MYLVWGYSDRLGHLGGDAAYYLMMAHAYTPSAIADAVYAAAAHDTRFPPLYPLLLAVFGAADSLQAVSVITTGCFILALWFFYRWQIEIGLSAAWAATTAATVAAMPGSLLLALCPQSEYLYLLLSLLTLWCIEKFERSGRESRTDIYAAAALLAAACLTRSIGVVLFLPLIVSLARTRSWRSAAGPLAVAIAPVLSWRLLHVPKWGYADIFASSYANVPFAAFLWHQIVSETSALAHGFAENLMHAGHMFALTLVLAACVLAAAVKRAAAWRADGIYVLAYLAVLLVWPFPEEAARFVWVVLPVGLAQLALLVTRGRAPRPRFGFVLAAVLFCSLGLLISPALTMILERYRAEADIDGANRYVSWYAADSQKALVDVLTQQTIVEGLRGIAGLVPPSACVISVKPQLVSYYADRFSVAPPGDAADDRQFERGLRDSGCAYVAMLGGKQESYPVVLYPSRRIPATSDIVDMRGFSAGEPPTNYVTFKLARLPGDGSR